jgi:dethiobiotin synthetase
MSHSYFVTGTDTEIGKTLVTAALVYKLNVLNPGSACAYKPVVAGTYRNSVGLLCNEDLETYLLVQDPAIPQNTICPYVLDTPAAPHLVATEYGIRLELDRMVQGYQTLHTQVAHVIAEGAGGFLTPIDDRHDLSTFAMRIQAPVILTVGMRLGCINHTLLTTEAIEKRGLTLAGWVANCIDPNMAYFNENITTLQDRIKAPLLGSIAYLPPNLLKKVNAPYSIEAIQFAAAAIALP